MRGKRSGSLLGLLKKNVRLDPTLDVPNRRVNQSMGAAARQPGEGLGAGGSPNQPAMAARGQSIIGDEGDKATESAIDSRGIWPVSGLSLAPQNPRPPIDGILQCLFASHSLDLAAARVIVFVGDWRRNAWS